MGIIVVVLIFALFQRIEVIDFFVLSYALISILFVMESRIAVGIALACLICCPFLLIQKNGVLAETTAVYAYYFLVITVLTQIREHRRESRDVPR